MNDEAYMNNEDWAKVREILAKLQEVTRPGHEDRAVALAGVYSLQNILHRNGQKA